MARSHFFVLSIGFLLGVLLLCFGPVGPQNSQGSELYSSPLPRYPYLPGTMNVTMEVVVDGLPLPTVFHAGRAYLPVPRPGAEYEIRVRNHGARRVVAVVSVDGLSVISGQAASETDSGYLVDPAGHILIKGWRRNLDSVAAFRFVDREKSYASLVGKPENIGVIGLAAIEEMVGRPRPRLLLEKTDSAPSTRAIHGEVGSIGTQYGRDVDSRVYYVPFVRSANKQRVTVHYDTVEALRAAGVPVDGRLPIAFPEDPRFAPPPPGYREK